MMMMICCPKKAKKFPELRRKKEDIDHGNWRRVWDFDSFFRKRIPIDGSLCLSFIVSMLKLIFRLRITQKYPHASVLIKLLLCIEIISPKFQLCGRYTVMFFLKLLFCIFLYWMTMVRVRDTLGLGFFRNLFLQSDWKWFANQRNGFKLRITKFAPFYHIPIESVFICFYHSFEYFPTSLILHK